MPLPVLVISNSRPVSMNISLHRSKRQLSWGIPTRLTSSDITSLLRSGGGQNSAFHRDARELDFIRILTEWSRFAHRGFSRFVGHVFTDHLSSQRLLSFRRRPGNGRHVTEDDPRSLHRLSVH